MGPEGIGERYWSLNGTLQRDIESSWINAIKAPVKVIFPRMPEVSLLGAMKELIHTTVPSGRF
jgi:hypothetical protein